MAGSGGAGTAPREHRLQPGDTLPGLALRYGVTMEQIQRANRLFSSDTIFLKPTLLIPAAVPPQEPFPRERPGAGDSSGDSSGDTPGDTPEPPNPSGDTPGVNPEPPNPSGRDLSASDFLRRLDAEIGRCKEAAAQRLRSHDTGPTPARAAPSPSSPRGAQLGPRALTRTPKVAALRDSEDEIFTL